jgi:predicted negative regulator of RcsB-dependent stress response
MIKDIVLDLVEELKQECRKNWYSKWIFALLLLGSGGFGGWKAYALYVKNREQQAQVAFSHALDEYHNLVQSAALQDSRWDDSAISFKAIAQKFPNTVYGNFAEVFVADIALHKGSVEESVALLEQWISKNSEKNSLYYLYKTRLALLYCDVQKVQEGVALLQELAHTDKNNQKDMAQFFLGYYYWSTNDVTQAKQVWQILIDAQKDQSPEGVSPWAGIAESKLRYIAS